MLARALPAVTPPLVNTGLEVSSVDKNTLGARQRGRILLPSVPIVHEAPKPPTVLQSFMGFFIHLYVYFEIS